MKIHTIGIDLGKTKFHIVGLNKRGEVVVRKQFSRGQLLRFTANRKVHLIGMEACGGSHFRFHPDDPDTTPQASLQRDARCPSN